MDDEWLQRYFDASVSRDGARVAAFMAADATYEDVAAGVVYEGPEAIVAFMAQAFEVSADLQLTFMNGHSSGDRYTFEWEMVGTHTGEGASGLPATNKPFRIRGISTGRRDREGNIKEQRDYWDMAAYLSQLGLLPPPTA